ncbi:MULTISPECIES: hypothetical protein [Pseudoalteromonas]|uniref:DUF4303 domain-containing protein n=1 Tax=Pseudoalteromonas luteoviolacea (strain 2ta16) TaxID=1353533 RepID=V4HLF7_PSEL2|nr:MULTISPECIES: hypothetical protein [Pseudoalteromonas]ESP90608.1 hypothetical protein PL2TA16_01712 [Pseudoalteromonas luteoviolacea 2ta16]KZN41819.1 hypothetical protein N483_14200 [Pseudoalteromonas luteoviolacea NCIMB 1944]MCG7550420.1 hypothetical protein [Pseudoalteromonas sp. Of7M-16]
MVSAEELSYVYENVLVKLIEQREKELKFYIQQPAFSHMTLSVAFWHSDMYWNLYQKESCEFTCHAKYDNQEFIILSDYEGRHPDISNLRDIFDGWSECEATENSDESLDLQFKLAHEALAIALCSERVKPLLEVLLETNNNYQKARYSEMIRVEDPDGRFDVNFLQVV